MPDEQVENVEQRASLIDDLEGLQADLYEKMSGFIRTQRKTATAADDVRGQVKREMREGAKEDSFAQFSGLLDRATQQIKDTGNTKYLVDLYRLALEYFKGPNFHADRNAAERKAKDLLPLSGTFSVLDQKLMDTWKKILKTYNLIAD